MREKLKKLNILLICLLILMGSFSSYADSKFSYVKDLAICYSGLEEAESVLSSAGYKMIPKNILGRPQSNGVYIGYSVTNDPNEAIRDIKLMEVNQNSSVPEGYSYVKTTKGAIANIYSCYGTNSVALLTSKSKDCGDPIVSESLVFISDLQDRNERYNRSLVFFGGDEKEPFNLHDVNYVSDEFTPLYLLFQSYDSSLNNVASVFSDDYSSILIVTPLLAAIVVAGGFILKKRNGRKK